MGQGRMSYLGIHPYAGDMVDHHTTHVQLFESKPCLVQVVREHPSLEPILAVIDTACVPGQVMAETAKACAMIPVNS